MSTENLSHLEIGTTTVRMCMDICEGIGIRHADRALLQTNSPIDADMELAMSLACFECSERLRQAVIQGYSIAGLPTPADLTQPRRLSDTKRHNKPLANPNLSK